MSYLRIHHEAPLHASRVALSLLSMLVFCVPWEEEVSAAHGVAISHVVGLAAFGAGIFAVVLDRRIRKLHLLHYLLGALVLWMAASYLWSIDQDLTVVRVESCIQLLVMVWLMWEFAPAGHQQVLLLVAYVLGTYVSALSTIYSFVTGTGSNLGLIEGRYTARGFDENELCITLALSLAMSCYLLAKRVPWWPIWLFHIPLCVFAILLTGSRGGFIACTVAALSLPLSFQRFGVVEKWAAAGILGASLLAAPILIPTATWQRLGSIHSEVSEGTLSKRTPIWVAGLDVYREHPVIGVGAGAFGTSVSSRLGIVTVAHNSYLSVLIELGAVGATIFLLLLLTLAWLGTTLPQLEARLWSILLLTWSVAVLSLTWEHRKPTWFLFGLLIAQSTALRSHAQTESASARLATASRLLLPAA